MINLSEQKTLIESYYFADEQTCVDLLLASFRQTPLERQHIRETATKLIEQIRKEKRGETVLQDFIREYDLSTPEGVILMCLAESLLRIPDNETANRLIEDKLGGAEWNKHLGQSASFLVNASSWGLVLSGKWMRFTRESHQKPSHLVKRLLAKSGETITRVAIKKAMAMMGEHFVMGKTIDDAIKRAQLARSESPLFSFDMLGEAALTQEDAEHFFNAYEQAVVALGRLPESEKAKVGISIKLSALHPRYDQLRHERVMQELVPRLLELICRARDLNIAVTIDAEESARLMLSLEIFEDIYRDPKLTQWNGFGLVVQSYQKRAIFVVDWLVTLAKEVGKVIPVRLVKGAYWDSEAKRAQQHGLENYPLFTRKEASDLAYLVCAQKLLGQSDVLYPQFATHNAHTAASILVYAKNLGTQRFEFQRLHGMGEALYTVLSETLPPHEIPPCRVYAPVGNYKELLPYLIRRLLENGANSSFVHHVSDATKPISDLIEEPSDALQIFDEHHARLPLPAHLFGSERLNSFGLDLNADPHLLQLQAEIEPHMQTLWQGGAWMDGKRYQAGDKISVLNPANRQEVCGELFMTPTELAEKALESAHNTFSDWMATSVLQRAAILNEMANLLEKNRGALISLCIREAGKTWSDAIGEVREAVDFCRYYAVQATRMFAKSVLLPGVTGENNFLFWEGRGVFLCISPWNFPLAIFVGQIAAALVSGNTVIAKPAEQTSLMAGFVTELFFDAGIPKNVLHCLPGDGASLGNFLTQDTRIAGVVFTGGTQTAKIIQRSLASREGPIVPLIAETGGQNAMIVDSSALAEQVVHDVLTSAFNSAGQRCSALRVLFLQHEIADSILHLLVGALSEWTIGDPSVASMDMGPVIDEEARAALLAHLDYWRTRAKFFYQLPLPPETVSGYFVAPSIIEIENLADLKQEVFGPVLHVIRYSSKSLDAVITSINQTGYGLTLGIHSRVETTVDYLKSKIRVGNVYVNRNMIGAVVGVQPFGGLGLSGTGPKAGGPHYLLRFATERTETINTAAIGGNVQLLTQGAG